MNAHKFTTTIRNQRNNSLSSTGSQDSVAAAVPFGVYNGSQYFLTGAAKQVDFVYKRLGGDVG